MRIRQGGRPGSRFLTSAHDVARFGRAGGATIGPLRASRLALEWGPPEQLTNASAIVVPELMLLIGKAFAGSRASRDRRSYRSVRHSSHDPEGGEGGQN